MPRHRPPSRDEGFPPAFAYNFSPRSASQARALELARECETLFLLGPAGTGKTLTAVAIAAGLIHTGQCKRLVVTRPCVEAGESLGFLPGGVGDKVEPYLAPIRDSLAKVTFKFPSAVMDIRPIAYLRGVTFEDSVALLDEAQNCTEAQLKLFLTRLGEGSKLVISGDTSQSDLLSPHNRSLGRVVSRLEGVRGIGVVHFGVSDVVRHRLVREILERLSRDESCRNS